MAASVSVSRLGPASSAMSVRWSFIHTPSKTASWPPRAQVSRTVAQSTPWGEVLKLRRTWPLTTGRPLLCSAQAGRAASRDPAVGTRVTAPSLAEVTSAAYLANTPLR